MTDGAAPDHMWQDCELDGPPAFDYGAKVRAKKHIKNDGTVPGATIGQPLVRKGEVGYVHSIGPYLNRFYVYGIDFPESGRLVGLRRSELDLVEDPQ